MISLAIIGLTTVGAGLTSFPLAPPGLVHVVLGLACVLTAGQLFRSVAAGSIGFKAWLGVPVLLGAGTWIIAADSMSGFLSDLAAADVGVGTALISFAGLQAWADRRSDPDWTVILGLLALIIIGFVIGLVGWFSGGA